MGKHKQKILENLKNTCCRLKPSKIEGVGVFAICDIPRGANPFSGVRNNKWLCFSKSDLRGANKEVFKMIDDFFVVEKNGTVYIPEYGLNGMDISFFLNNSKKPNLKIAGGGKEEALKFVASRHIKKGEELTVSYASFDSKYK